MLFIISGPSSVGKSIIVSRFIKSDYFNRMVPYTSRKIRDNENETDGVEYFFRSWDEIKSLSKNFTTGYWDFPFNNVYGYSSEIIEVINSEKKFIILATTKIALSIKNDFPSVTICFIDFQTDAELNKRITYRFGPDTELTKQKLQDAVTERANKKLFDIQVASNDPNILFEELRKLFNLL